ncbi:hypothetical protein C8J42_102534 [Sphingomonas sp. PP-CE-1A-559]|uniref:hypothetical protein n=1 Tax=Sphingomonas sp. PP-CE-1A-559 TaxID=2135657 RepID=UPI0010543C95|nr:hypothetical protein [Sphingomonas sp. PP-CE-1A-559]TCP92758.1 hypothetical protein C8J42_102534 [Sphingomonas sp. PP-CE-1A-559]
MSQISIDTPVWVIPAAKLVGPILLSSFVGAFAGLWSFRQQGKERLRAAVTWQWTHGYHGETEEPFLTVQNSSNVPAYLVKARFLRGNFLKREAFGYAFDYVEVTDGSYPMELKAASVSTFPLAKYRADKIAEGAGMTTRFLGRLKRPYIWLELKTIGGSRIVIAANDATSFEKRPKWLGKG